MGAAAIRPCGSRFLLRIERLHYFVRAPCGRRQARSARTLLGATVHPRVPLLLAGPGFLSSRYMVISSSTNAGRRRNLVEPAVVTAEQRQGRRGSLDSGLRNYVLLHIRDRDLQSTNRGAGAHGLGGARRGRIIF